MRYDNGLNSGRTAWSLGHNLHLVISSFELQGILVPIDGYKVNAGMYIYDLLISKKKLAELIDVAKQGIDLMCDKNYKQELHEKELLERASINSQNDETEQNGRI